MRNTNKSKIKTVPTFIEFCSTILSVLHTGERGLNHAMNPKNNICTSGSLMEFGSTGGVSSEVVVRERGGGGDTWILGSSLRWYGLFRPKSCSFV